MPSTERRRHGKRRVDDSNQMARVGRKLLNSRWAPRQGMALLNGDNQQALRAWGDFLRA